MKAWAIFVHSIRQVFGNLPEALQISGLIYLAQMAIAIALGVTTTAMEATTEPTGAEATKVTIAMMAMLIALMWIAVAWHRFVLLNERPAGYLPQLSLQRLGRYAGRSVLIAVLSLLIGIAFNNAGYLTENFRGALKAIPETQTRAARSLGMTPIQAFQNVILPQMLRISFLPMTNQMVWAILMTSLGAVVAMNTDLYGVTSELNARTFRTFELFAIAAVIFYVITKAITLSARLLAARLFRY